MNFLRSRRHTAPPVTSPIETFETPVSKLPQEAPMLESPPVVEVSPEIADAERRLGLIADDLVSPELREAVFRGARVAIFAREAHHSLVDLRVDLAAAVTNRDSREAAEFAAAIAAQEKVLEVLPGNEDLAPAAEPCMVLAREKLAAAASQIQEAPVLSATAERSAYRSLPVHLVT